MNFNKSIFSHYFHFELQMLSILVVTIGESRQVMWFLLFCTVLCDSVGLFSKEDSLQDPQLF